jgi:hypothetical protein
VASGAARILEAGVGLSAAPTSALTAADERARPARKRLKIWEIPSIWLCSIIGTCLTPVDVDRIVRHAGIRFQDGTEAYEIHGFMVARAAEQGRVGREINKALDEKYAALVRKVGAEEDQGRLAALWDELCGRGLVAGAYWAIISHAHVAEALKVHAFGEVHMLSHFMGGHNRQHAKALWLAERRAEQLAERLAKSRRQAQETGTEKDRRIAELESELRQTREQLTGAWQRAVRQSVQPRPVRRLEAQLARREQKLSSARARIRVLERENERVRGILQALCQEDGRAPGPSGARATQEAATALTGGHSLEGCRLLYVGGRCQLVPFLRQHAEAHQARLLHHDGGEEQTLQVLEDMVDQADIVFCPVDCVSHQACLKAKLLCRRFSKPFVPLRSSSTSSFLRALRHRTEGAETFDRPLPRGSPGAAP